MRLQMTKPNPKARPSAPAMPFDQVMSRVVQITPETKTKPKARARKPRTPKK